MKWSGILLCVLVLALAAPHSAHALIRLGSPNTATLTRGLVVYLPFDGSVTNWTSRTTTDLSGTGNNGSIMALTAGTSTVPGRIGQAFFFDGNQTNPGVRVANSSSVAITGDITLSAWVKTTSLAPQIVISRWGGLNAYALVVNTGHVNAYLTGQFGSNGAVNDGKWHLITATHNSSQDVIYIDGKADTSHASSVPISDDGDVVEIGYEGDGFGGDPFQGSIDDVRIYNRSLSATEVSQLYGLGSANAGHASTVTVSKGLIAYWPLDGSATNWTTGTTQDLSASGNTGHLVNLSTTTTPAAGRIGQAFNFDTSASYVINSSVINTPVATVSAWVNIAAYPAASAIVAGFVDGDGNGTYDKDLYINSSGQATFYSFDGSGVPVTSSSISLNTWHHLVGTVDGSKETLYVDGAPVGTAAIGNTFTGYTGPDILIHGTSAGFTGRLNAKIDDVRIYNRALSTSEVKQLYSLGAATAGHSNTIISNGLVFDGNATNWATGKVRDVSGNGNDGSLILMSTTTSPVAGKIGQALTYSGSAQYISVPDASSLNPTAAVTVSAWVKHAGAITQWQSIVTKGDGSYRLHLNTNTSAFDFGTTHGGGAFTDTDSGIIPVNGQWYHVVGVHDANGDYIYVNGVLKATSSYTANLDVSIFPVGIGENTEHFSRSWDGVIDDVRIYNRALSATEIQQLYNAGR
jgi:hypothetical protein